jgi:pheromone shutdown-related protein TraB
VELPASVTTVVDGETTYHIVGTAHVSQRSVDEVRAVIEATSPDVVCVELCPARYDALTRGAAFRDLDVFKVVREGKILYLLAHLALASYQRKLGASLGVKPGAELLAAIEAAKARGIPVELVDRDIHITLRRTWHNVGIWRRMTLLFGMVAGAGSGEPVTAKTVEDLKEPKALDDMLVELGRAIPEVKGPLVDERDLYLASKTRAVGAHKRTVVAVVGAAHVPGMRSHWRDAVDIAALERIPPPALWWRIAKWVVPLALLGALVWLWAHTDAGFARAMIAWIVPTCIGAGLFTAVTGGSLASVATAVAISPIARLYPLVRTSIVVGLVEAWRRKPSVADCERLPEDTQTVRGFWRNPVTRLLIVAAMAGIGAFLGFVVGVTWLVSVL